MEFEKFSKIARYSRDCVITEKIDGTNAQICITDEGDFLTGSRTRWITPEDDNYGFSRWANENKEELLKLGKGNHFGEWWGQGIQREYGMDKKVFSLFNTHRWAKVGKELKEYKSQDPKQPSKFQEYAPSCCRVVPVIHEGLFCDANIQYCLNMLVSHGSYAADIKDGRSFKNPEGVVIFHTAQGYLFKKTIIGDEKPKKSREWIYLMKGA